jgi:hypothetical protein
VTFALPNPNDFESQVQAGQNLISQIQAGDTDSLLQAGISLAGNAIGGQAGAVLTDALGGAMSGYAMAGPMGAAIGAVIGIAEAFSSLSSPADEVVAIWGVSSATQTITQRVAAMASSSLGIYSGNPVGWHMADYCAFASPPGMGSSSLFSILKSSALKIINDSDPHTFGEGVTSQDYNATAASQLQGVTLQSTQALCTPVWFYWYASTQVADCYQDIYFGSGGAGGPPSQLMQTWLQNTNSSAGLSKQTIVQRAIARAPDPAFWSADLYGQTMSSGLFSSGFATVYYNPDLMNAMATVFMMLAAGASVQAIVSELLIQAAILNNSGTNAPGQGPGTLLGGTQNQYGFKQLLAFYINLAKAENEAAGVTPSTWDMVGAVAGGALIAILGGTLAYSLYKHESPIVVAEGGLGRVRTAVGRVGRRFT